MSTGVRKISFTSGPVPLRTEAHQDFFTASWPAPVDAQTVFTLSGDLGIKADAAVTLHTQTGDKSSFEKRDVNKEDLAGIAFVRIENDTTAVTWNGHEDDAVVGYVSHQPSYEELRAAVEFTSGEELGSDLGLDSGEYSSLRDQINKYQ